MAKLVGKPLALILAHDTRIRKSIASGSDPDASINALATTAFEFKEIQEICEAHDATKEDLEYVLQEAIKATSPEPTIITEDNLRVTLAAYYLYQSAALGVLFHKCEDARFNIFLHVDGDPSPRAGWAAAIRADAVATKLDYVKNFGVPRQTGDPFSSGKGCLVLLAVGFIVAFILAAGTVRAGYGEELINAVPPELIGQYGMLRIKGTEGNWVDATQNGRTLVILTIDDTAVTQRLDGIRRDIQSVRRNNSKPDSITLKLDGNVEVTITEYQEKEGLLTVIVKLVENRPGTDPATVEAFCFIQK